MNSLMRHGRKSLELHKWCSLRFSGKLEQNASACSNSASTTSHASPQENFIISNLIDLYGWIKKTLEWVSRVKSLEEEEEEEADSESVSNLFRSHCHKSRDITCYPRLLIADDAEKALVPNLSFFSPEELQALSASTMITLETFYGTKKKKKRNSMISPQGKQENLIRDVFILKVLGVPQELLIPLLNFNTLESVNVKEKYKKSIKEVVEMGFDPTTLKIFQALRVFYVLRDKTIQEKVSFYTRLGMASTMYGKCSKSFHAL